MFYEKEIKENLIKLLSDYFKIKSSSYHIDMAFLYGSWAKGYPHEGSDLDLAILFSVLVENENIEFELINNISYELSIKASKEVNIIAINKDFPYPMLYYNAIILGIPLYTKDKEELLSLKLEALRQMEDFSTFGIPWQQEITKKTLKEIAHA